MSPDPILLLVGIGLLGIASQSLAWRFQIPSILFLLLAGVLAGPVTGWLDPDTLFGELLFPSVSLAVALILFEGSLTLRFQEIRGLERVVRNMVSYGALVSGAITAAATHWLVGLPWSLSTLFGALMVVTGPTVVVPMLRTVRPNAKVAQVLRWEGIVIDPLGALLTVLVFQVIVSSRGVADFKELVETFATICAAGLGAGLLFGWAMGEILRRHWLPEYLWNVAVLNAVLACFVAADLLEHEAGLLAVTVMGMYMANRPGIPVKEILDFKESLSLLLISALFVVLAARIDLRDFTTLGWGALGLFVVLQLVARPVKVWLATLGSSLTWKERALIAWIGPRGIVAAAIAAGLSFRLEAAGIAEASLLVPLSFAIIVSTALLQSLTARPLANWLGVSEPEPRGMLIVGANPVARAIGKALHGHGFPVLLTDPSWDNVRAARMAGLPVYFGNPVSEHADRHLDLVGLGILLGLSSQPELNALAATRYRIELGSKSVYTLRSPKGPRQGDRYDIARAHSGHVLFDSEVDYTELADRLREGGGIRSTTLTEEFDYAELNRLHRNNVLPLFALTPKGRLRIFTADESLDPAPGWTLISLLPPEER